MNIQQVTMVFCFVAIPLATPLSAVASSPPVMNPVSVTAIYQKNHYDKSKGTITLGLEQDDEGNLKSVSLSFDGFKVRVPASELAVCHAPYLDKARFFREFEDEEGDGGKVLHRVEIPFAMEPRAWGEDAQSVATFVFDENTYLHVDIKTPVNKGQWRITSKLPGQKPVLVGIELVDHAVSSSGSGNPSQSQKAPASAKVSPSGNGEPPNNSRAAPRQLPEIRKRSTEPH